MWCSGPSAPRFMRVLAGHLIIISTLLYFLDVVLRTFGPSLYKSAGHLNIIFKSYLDVMFGTFGPSICLQQSESDSPAVNFNYIS